MVVYLTVFVQILRSIHVFFTSLEFSSLVDAVELSSSCVGLGLMCDCPQTSRGKFKLLQQFNIPW
jgi:hypothetical protein